LFDSIGFPFHRLLCAHDLYTVQLRGLSYLILHSQGLRWRQEGSGPVDVSPNQENPLKTTASRIIPLLPRLDQLAKTNLVSIRHADTIHESAQCGMPVVGGRQSEYVATIGINLNTGNNA
jgi:hypothetical protein